MMFQSMSVLIAIVFSLQLSAASKDRYYLLPEKVFKLVSKKHPQIKRLEKRAEFSVIKVTPETIEKVTADIHHELGTCGGFFDITGEYQENALTAFDVNGFREQRTTAFVDPFKNRGIKHASFLMTKLGLVKKERFRTSLERLTQFPDRSARTENGKKAAEWLRDEVLAYAQGRDDVSVELIQTSGYLQPSVVVKLAGKVNAAGVLIGAHIDTYSRNKPGADDDGSGTASVLEVFRALIDSGVKYENDLYFAFYAAEEVGLVGSKHVVEKFKQRNIKLQGVFHLDMTGFLSSRESKQLYFLQDYTTDVLNQWTRKLAMQVLQIPADKIGNTSCNYACSDHANWNRKGYATVYPFESSFSNYNRSIHSSRDTIAKLDMDHAIRFARLGFAFMAELGEPVSE
ncbi:hypothetical protein COB52_05995 [Candidatus Kaiserbacteria bacterium]|nr:MAG: hypothetical protein COB52_05995 [Candidatus Kaiserbacteria bacterium]